MSRYVPGGEVAVIGLGRSGRSAALLCAQRGMRVYVSDSDSKPAVVDGAAMLEAKGIATQTGGHDLARIARASLVVVSPGVPPHAAALIAARNAGVPVISEIEVALDALPHANIIAVTGTNGKTTTTALVAHLLTSIGLNAVAAGNIGTPLASFALKEKPPAWFALEVSSFQLHDTPGLNPVAGILTNLTPDHLDRYASVDEYYGDKALLFANAHAGSHWILNADSNLVRTMTSGVAGVHHEFSLERRDVDAWYDRAGDCLMLMGQPLLDRRALTLLGDHNVANALAAALAVAVADPAHATAAARAAMSAGLASFRALAHRLEVVGEFGGVEWINDSKATNVDASRVAIAGMTRPTVLLLGGRHKGDPYTSLADVMAGRVKCVLAYGEAAPIVEADLGGLVPVERLGSSFEQVMARARAVAVRGDAVLLSPACSSYDMFNNYEERGAEFRRLAGAQ